MYLHYSDEDNQQLNVVSPMHLIMKKMWLLAPPSFSFIFSESDDMWIA